MQEISMLHAEELDLVAGGARVSPANASNVEYFVMKSLATQGGVGAGLSRQGWRTTRVSWGVLPNAYYPGSPGIIADENRNPKIWPQDRYDDYPNDGSF